MVGILSAFRSPNISAKLDKSFVLSEHVSLVPLPLCISLSSLVSTIVFRDVSFLESI